MEQAYKDFPYILNSKGIVARYAPDQCPPQTYLNLQNLEVRQENAISSRLGRSVVNSTQGTGNLPIFSGISGAIHSLGRLKTSTTTFRYAACVGNVFRIQGDSSGAFNRVSALNEFSGARISTLNYRPNFSSSPWLFLADQAVMRKDNGTFNPMEQWGIFPPVAPVSTQLGGILETDIDLFGTNVTDAIPSPPKTYTSIAPATVNISAISRTGGVVTVVTSSAHNIPTIFSAFVPLVSDVQIAGVTDGSYDGVFRPAVINTTTFTYVQAGPNTSSSGGTVGPYEVFNVNTSISSIPARTGLVTITPVSMTNITVGMALLLTDALGSNERVIVTAVTGSTFTAYVGNIHFPGENVLSLTLSGVINSGITAQIVATGPFDLDTSGALHPSTSLDLISMMVNTNNTLASIIIYFDVGDGSFTDYYVGVVDLSGLTLSTWSQLTIQLGSFTAVGLAGTVGHTFNNVSAYNLTITAGGSSSSVQFTDLYLQNVGGPVVADGGSPYDYRETFFNNNTGHESNPGVEQVPNAYLSPSGSISNTIAVSLIQPPDSQVTHLRLYRRGGTLNTGWTMVAQVPVGTQSYLDGFNDDDIADNDLLELDNDVPLTTTLPVPVTATLVGAVVGGGTQTVALSSVVNVYVNQQMTIDVGNLQETVIVQAVAGNNITAYFQLSHLAGTAVTATTRSGHAVNVGAVAFEMAWLIGDADNPDRLYYSKPEDPESFPPQNWIEIGTPSDPLMGVVAMRGQIFVFSLSRVYRVVVYPGVAPVYYPTSSRHGLAASFAWCVEESQIWYRSQDGIYVFEGDDSKYVSEPIEWLLANKEPNLSYIGIGAQDINLDMSNITPAIFSAASCMAYAKNEVFYSYQGVDGTRRRLIFDTAKQRWRNDGAGYLSMLFEEDTQNFLCGDSSNGLVYIDRTGDFDSGGYVAGSIVENPIAFQFQSPALDQGYSRNNKIYTELTIDLDTSGQSGSGITISALVIFDLGMTTENVFGPFVLSSNGRSQIPLLFNNGEAYAARTVTVSVDGVVVAPVHLYGIHIKAAVDAEYRLSYDSYWDKFGTDEPKFIKQCYLEYVAPDAGGINFSVYTEGSALPAFSFNAPQALTRTVLLVRVPPTKFHTFRTVGVSVTPFQLYGESHWEWKPVTGDKGYAKAKFGQISAQGGV